jgi:ABC-type transporter Mla subunit MlaD
VTSFVRDNRKQLASDVGGLATLTSVLNREKRLLGYMVDLGAVGVSNYPHMYTPSQRTYNARFDGNTISGNPVLFACQLLMSAGGSPTDCLRILKPITQHLPSGGGAP